jgi:RNA polymerase sigma-70 factor (ECF subfamily)
MPTDALDDAELARGIAGGGAPELERELARRFAGRIRLYGLRHLRDRELAADLVQEVLLVVVVALRAGKVDDAALIDRFILGTCRNLASTWRRRERRRADLAGALAAEDELAAAPAAPALPDPMRLYGCLSGLPPRDLSVLILTFCEERSADEIGRGLGLTAGNVRVVRHRALAQVRQCLGAEAMPS